MKIKILHLYYDLLNLYGEYGNINILKQHLEDLGIQVAVDKKTINDDFNINTYDFVYCGSGLQSHMLIALEDLKKHKNELVEYIDDKKCALFTGNSIEMLGKEVCTKSNDNQKVQGLNIFNYEVELLDDCKTGDVIYKSELLDNKIVGFIYRQANLKNNDNHLFDVEFGIGENEDNFHEGAYRNNLFATYVVGPILVRNPYFLKFIIKKILGKNYVDNNLEYKNEIDAYELVLKELENRK